MDLTVIIFSISVSSTRNRNPTLISHLKASKASQRSEGCPNRYHDRFPRPKSPNQSRFPRIIIISAMKLLSTSHHWISRKMLGHKPFEQCNENICKVKIGIWPKLCASKGPRRESIQFSLAATVMTDGFDSNIISWQNIKIEHSIFGRIEILVVHVPFQCSRIGPMTVVKYVQNDCCVALSKVHNCVKHNKWSQAGKEKVVNRRFKQCAIDIGGLQSEQYSGPCQRTIHIPRKT